MTYIITIALVAGICLLICAVSCEDDNKVSAFAGIALTSLLFGITLLVFFDCIYISAEDYLNNPSAYQLDTVGTHINVSVIHAK